MVIEFSTTEKHRALQYLKDAYPNCNVTNESAKEILDLVGIKIRVGDPSMYGYCPIFPVGNCSTKELAPIFRNFISKIEGV